MVMVVYSSMSMSMMMPGAMTEFRLGSKKVYVGAAVWGS